MRADLELMFLPYDDRSEKTLADVLVRELRGGEWAEFHAAVAFARQTGNFEELQAALQKFCDDGGTVKLTFGANTFEHSEGSDYEAIQTLLTTLERYPNAHIFLFQDPRRTFHPKVYVFSNVGSALLIIGSSNWSDGGFINNIEVNPVIRLNFDNKPEADFFARVIKIFDTYWTENPGKEEGQGWARRVTNANLAEFKDILRTSVERSSTPKRIEETATDSDKIFYGVHFKTKRRFTAARRKGKKVEIEVETAATVPIEPAREEEEIGFWKVLSGWDTSATSAPGQIQIPMQFREFFPAQVLVKEADAAGKGRQWDTTFPVEFQDGDFTTGADGRFIVYEPEKDHPRSNTECRFTFHNRAVSDRLRPGDILSFRFRAPSEPILVERFSPSTPTHQALRTSKKRWGKV